MFAMTNEEKILSILEGISKKQDSQEELLKRQDSVLSHHSDMLKQQGDVLTQHSDMLKQQSALLETLSQTQQEHGKKLQEHGAALDSIAKELHETQIVSQRTAVLVETEIRDKLQLLFDGHQTILDTLAPKSRIESLEDEVAFLKSVVKAISKEVAELKKAE